MFPTLYENITIGTVPQHHGLGVLSDCISCVVEHARNDIYELTMEYPISGIHAEDLAVRRVLKVKPNFTDDPQLFRISRIGKVMNGKFTVYAKHISYDLSGFEITSGTAGSAAAACSLLQSKANGFTITTDKTVNGTFKISAPASVKSFFVGKAGSFLDVYGKADIVYDNFNVRFLLNGGEDRGVTIRYGKNLLELSQEMGENNLYTHVMCYWKQDETVVSGSKVATGLSLDVPKCLIVDVSSEYDSAPTTAQLTARATKYKNDNNLTVPTNNITLDFVQSGELANRVDLCDTVSIYYEALGITRTQVKCIRTKWDCIKEKYIETEFGDALNSAVDTFVANNVKLANTPTTSYMAEAIAHATELITGNLGGYVILHDSNGDGTPDEILIMDKPDISEATNVWRFNQNGLGHATSYDGTYGLALTKDGQIVADRITSGTLNADIIKAGVISDAQGNSSIDMTNGAAVMTNFKAKTGFYLVDANGITRNYISYNTVGGTSLIQYNQNGKMNVVISSATGDGGQFRAYAPNGTEVANIGYGTDGGQFRAYNLNGKQMANIGCGAEGGKVYTWFNNEKLSTSIGSSTTGGIISAYNTNETLVAWIGTATNSGGYFALHNSSGTQTVYAYGQSGVITCVSVQQTSSRKVKENIKPIEDAKKILDLNAVSFDYKNKEQGTNKRGFIAEDVAEVLPNLVTPETEETPACLDYLQMIPYLQAVIKDQEKRIEALEKRLKALENAVS